MMHETQKNKRKTDAGDIIVPTVAGAFIGSGLLPGIGAMILGGAVGWILSAQLNKRRHVLN